MNIITNSSFRIIASKIVITYLKIGDFVKVIDPIDTLILDDEYQIIDIPFQEDTSPASALITIMNKHCYKNNYFANRFKKITKETK
jgi:hypothetical protein